MKTPLIMFQRHLAPQKSAGDVLCSVNNCNVFYLYVKNEQAPVEMRTPIIIINHYLRAQFFLVQYRQVKSKYPQGLHLKYVMLVQSIMDAHL